jgi:uncharacterized iron-regulated membrane protein
MNLRQGTFRLHRWLGLVIALQLLAWSLGGLYFTLFDIETIRGTADAVEMAPVSIELPAVLADAGAVARIAGREVVAAVLTTRRGRAVWELQGPEGRPLVLADPGDGALIPPVTSGEAERIARIDFRHPAGIVEAVWIESDPPLEFRGGRLPVWQVVLDHPKKVTLYIDPVNGEVLARRSRKWRIFDFFWMLHIMDYSEREDFSHPLLTAAALLAVLSALSGVLLWGYRIFRPRRQPVRPRRDG